MKKFFPVAKYATSDPTYHVDDAAEMTNSATLSTMTTARIMLTCCIHPQKPSTTYTRVN